jgi:dihydrofolate reductase
MIISIIAAVAENGVIGGNNALPWHLPLDMRFFMKTTEGHCILTGRRNYESIPEKFRPLKNRTNIMVTNQSNYPTRSDRLNIVNSISKGIELALNLQEKELFIIGGGQIYQQAMHLADRLYLTEIKHQFDGDTYFPVLDDSAWDESSRIICKADPENAYEMHFVVLEK